MKYGIDIPNFGYWSDPRNVVEFARQVEDAGWDGLSLWDHILLWDGNEVADPWILLAAAASATERITLMNLVAPLPRRHPWKLAREAVSIDLLSSGRFILGVGIGWPTDPEFTRFHQEEDIKVRGDMLDEGLDILAGLWSGEPFSYDGEHYTIDEVTFLPKPLQQPRIPIWVAGMWPGGRPFRRAAKWDGVAPIAYDGKDITMVGADELRGILEFIGEHRETDEPFDATVADMWLGDRARARDQIAELDAAGATWVRESWVPGAGVEWEDWMSEMRAGPPR
jgi:alkanesulfonate monooxygenase SsuD/methylene tetrahydromethanopterin reductase-like flavin-dependent oxidoreductase (luciferase family)